jgi:uncharacterized glyoxalase superfamily protein PhnB
MTALTFGGLNLVCADVEKSVAFYRLLGVEIPADKVWRGPSGGVHHVDVQMSETAGLDLDSHELAAVYNKGYQPALGGSLVIGFNVPARADVDAVYARITGAGYPGLMAPYDAFWGSRYAIVADPDGNHVGVMSPSDPAMRSRGPEL